LFADRRFAFRLLSVMSGLLILVIALAVAVATLAVIPVVIAVARTARRRSVENASPILRAEAVVVDKRTHIIGSGRESAQQLYFVTFQFPDGSRRELEVPALESGVLVLADRGTLEWRGPRYRGFTREILR
jgi:hypothetical protein